MRAKDGAKAPAGSRRRHLEQNELRELRRQPGQQWLQPLLLYLCTSLVFLCPALLSSVALETEFQGPFTAWLQATTLLHADGEPAEGAPTLSSGRTSPGLP